ncbi:MAG: hypothetical protein GQ564_12205 [Bacteroidales bacterium]|nr:hypothetical protein [Bacteroidales bacterium]
MNKLKSSHCLLFLILIFSFSCTKEKSFVIEPPIAGLETKFIEININPQKDSVYILENDTRIRISKGSILDMEGNPIMENINLKFRQFDDAVSIFLSGLPMSYTSTSGNMVLQTAGMYEIRGEYNNASVRIDTDKPISISIGSFYDDSRQGFFKLDEETGDWDLIDIPEGIYNEEVISLRDKVANLKPEWEIPLPPNFYVFSLGRMADIFLNDDWNKISKANMDVMKQKMKGYGVKTMNIGGRWISVKYKGNSYDAAEMLWEANKTLIIPKWAKNIYGSYYDNEKNEYKEQILLKKINGSLYKLTVIDYKNNKKWSANLKLITHLRYLIKYSPEQLIAKQKQIEQEIQEAEEKLKTLRLIEYTTEIYEMGIYNCDRPVYFREGKPQLNFSFDEKAITEKEIHKISVFNNDLSSYAIPTSYKPITCAFFKGVNKIVLISKNGDIGLFSGQDFKQLDSIAIRKSLSLEIPLTKIKVENEEELRELLKE